MIVVCNGEHPGREARRGPYTLDQCRLCWKVLNQEPPERPVGPVEIPVRTLPCLYLGATVDATACCPGQHIRRCAIHGLCTLESCKTCHEYEANTYG